MIWSNLIIVVQVISALSIIGLVLMQHGKGADMGAAFGSGASGSLFGASGSSNFMSKATAVAAAVFFGTTLTLAYIGNDRSSGDNAGVMGRAQAPAAGIPVTAPAQTAPADVPTLPAGSATPAAPAPAPAVPAPAAPAPASN
ncbi:preprotein translocase subunit SecG [Massilia aurea]|uniref:preprotein translocase subunit SecG n=1 Tax=Massilia aurea TaxID=373040 RepID=UPI00346272C7